MQKQQILLWKPQKYKLIEASLCSTKHNKNYLLNLSFSPLKIVKFLYIIEFFLIIASTIGQLYTYSINGERYRHLIRLFYVDAEQNFPTAYSFLILLICSILLAIIAIIKQEKHSRYIKHWKGLSIIFLMLSIDELCSIHEIATLFIHRTFKPSGLLYFGWVIPGMVFLSLFILTYLKFVLALPNKTKLGFIMAGTTFVLGAIGMELIGGWFFELNGSHNLTYVLFSSLEEMLEMSGIIFFIYTLLEYMKSQVRYYNLFIKN